MADRNGAAHGVGGDTLYLSEDGWQPIGSYKNGTVAQWSLVSRSAAFVYPFALTVRFSLDVFRVGTDTGALTASGAQVLPVVYREEQKLQAIRLCPVQYLMVHRSKCMFTGPPLTETAGRTIQWAPGLFSVEKTDPQRLYGFSVRTGYYIVRNNNQLWVICDIPLDENHAGQSIAVDMQPRWRV